MPPVNKANVTCHRCQQKGHYANECPRVRSQLLVQEGMKAECEDNVEAEYYDNGETFIVALKDIRGDSLVLRRICFAPNANVDWKRWNIFSTRCTINGKVCRVIIDTRSCENVISDEAIQKLKLPTEPHSEPYKLGWLNTETEVKVTRRCLIKFSLGPQYTFVIFCDVVPINAAHILLGRPWQFDNRVTYDGFMDCHTINVGVKKVVLQPMHESFVK